MTNNKTVKYDFYKDIIDGKELPSEEEIFYEVLIDNKIKYVISFAKHMESLKKKYPSLCCFPEDFLDIKCYMIDLRRGQKIFNCDTLSSDEYCIWKEEFNIKNNNITKHIILRNKNIKITMWYGRHLTFNTFYFSDINDAQKYLNECKNEI